MPGPEAILSVTDLRKTFDQFEAVCGLSFSVAGGEIFGLLGPNGAGKTTALRMLVGLLAPTSGKAWVDGIWVAQDPQQARKRLGFLTGSAGLYGRLTPREVLEHTAAMHDIPVAKSRQRMEEVIEALDLGDFINKRCETLSTGQKQRASLARAVIHDPPALVLDEPTSGVDVLASHGLRKFVSSERARGKAIIMSTHYLTEAELMCDRVGFMHRGKMLCEGTPESVRAKAQAKSLEEAFLRLVGAIGGAAPDGDPQ